MCISSNYQDSLIFNFPVYEHDDALELNTFIVRDVIHVKPTVAMNFWKLSDRALKNPSES